MDLESFKPEINTILDRLLADTASALVLLITPGGELAAYRGPGDRTTAASIVQLLTAFTEPSEPAKIDRMLLEAPIEGKLYLASLPRGWKLVLIDQEEPTSTRLSQITPFLRLAIADVAQILQQGPAISPAATADTLGLPICAEQLIAANNPVSAWE